MGIFDNENTIDNDKWYKEIIEKKPLGGNDKQTLHVIYHGMCIPREAIIFDLIHKDGSTLWSQRENDH